MSNLWNRNVQDWSCLILEDPSKEYYPSRDNKKPPPFLEGVFYWGKLLPHMAKAIKISFNPKTMEFISTSISFSFFSITKPDLGSKTS